MPPQQRPASTPIVAPGRLVGPRIADPPMQELLRSVADLPGTDRELTTGALDSLIGAAFAGRFDAYPAIRYGDSVFYLPTLAEVRRVLVASQLDRRTWLQDRFDCDDFAYVLKGEMSAHAYDTAERRLGLCFGMLWANFDWVEGFHAVNWVVTSDESIWLIEPQTDDIYPHARCTGGIALLLA